MLPLPIARLRRRALNAKSAMERHLALFKAFEASVQLAVAADPPREPALLRRATLGTWVAALRASEQRLSDERLLRLFALLSEDATTPKALRRDVLPRELFMALARYRNATELGHGSTRSETFYRQAAALLLEGLDAAWEVALFLPRDTHLCFVDEVKIGSDSRREARIFVLDGEHAELLDDGCTHVPTDVRPGRVQLRIADRWRELHPWLAYDAERERLWFFNGATNQARFLDFVSGEILRANELEACAPGLAADLRALLGEPLSPQAPPTPLAVRPEASAEATAGTRGTETAPLPPSLGPSGFRRLAVVGQGGMGIVHLALQAGLDRLVALKVLPHALAASEEALARFRQEIRALARCDHPNVVKILSSGQCEGTWFYAMEFVHGADLAQVARELAPGVGLREAARSAMARLAAERADLVPWLPRVEPDEHGTAPADRWKELARFFQDAALGVHHLHEHGIVHRDLKPANLAITTEGRAVVMDLGLAAVEDASETLTRDKERILGTLRYLAPEQLTPRLGPVDVRSDVYALGATLYELAAGRPVFTGEGESQLVAQILMDEPRPLRRVDAAIPRGLAAIVHQALEKKPERRYPSARDLADDFARFAADEPVHARGTKVVHRVVATVRRRRIPVLISAGVVLVLAIGAYFGRTLHKVGWIASASGREEFTVGEARPSPAARAPAGDGNSAPTPPGSGSAHDRLLAELVRDLEREDPELFEKLSLRASRIGLRLEAREPGATGADVERLYTEQRAGTAVGPLSVPPEAERVAIAAARAHLARARGHAAGDAARAADELQIGVELLTAADGPRSTEGLRLLWELGLVALDAPASKAAHAAWRRLDELHRELRLGVEAREVLEAQEHLAAALVQEGALAEARALLEKVVAEYEGAGLPDRPTLARARARLAAVARDTGDLATARALQEQVLEVRSRTLDAEHRDLQQARLDLAATLVELGDLRGARALQQGAVEVFTRTLPLDHADLQIARLQLAGTLQELGELHGARALEELAIEQLSLQLAGDHPDLQRARQNLGVTLYALGDLAGSRALFEQTHAVLARTLPTDHPDLQAAREGLAAASKALGDLEGARTLFAEVLAVRARTLPPDHRDLQRARGNLAATIEALGDLWGARALQEAVLESCARTLPDDHPELQAARRNLAATLKALGELSGARLLEEAVLEVALRTLPADHPDLQRAQQGLAWTMHGLGDFAGARSLFEQVLAIQARTLPDEHPDLQAARSGLAASMAAQGDLVTARALYEAVLAIRARTLPATHPDLQATRVELVRTLAALNAAGSGRAEDPEGYQVLVAAFLAALEQSARDATVGASSREAEERCANLFGPAGMALSFATGLGVFAPEPALERAAFEATESTRAAALVSTRLARAARSNPAYDALRDTACAATGELARLVQGGAGPEELDRARIRREEAERELALLALALDPERERVLELDPTLLAQCLPADSAAVAYRIYTRLVFAPGGGAMGASDASLCAFVLRPDAALARVELGPIAAVEEAVLEWRQSIGAAGEGHRGDVQRSTPGGRPASETGARLRALVFDPLLAVLADARRLVVVPDGVLHLVPLDALPLSPERGVPADGRAPATELVGDRWRVETRCTLAELLWQPPSLPEGGALVALGGPDFDHDPLDPSNGPGAAVGETTTGEHRSVRSRGDGRWQRGFRALPAAREEARGVAELHATVFGGASPAILLVARGASRMALEVEAPKARFLHIATVGWFAPESVRAWSDPRPSDGGLGAWAPMGSEERVRGSSPMLLCGLALAGANRPEDHLGRVRGTITAEELSALDLTGCELAVLSSCDSNVGVRRAGQGVASAQKALHMAGARSVISSLWKVPDEATKELFLDFYRRLWVEKQSKHQALWEAKRKLRDALDERGRPRYLLRDWAAWMLTGHAD